MFAILDEDFDDVDYSDLIEAARRIDDGMVLRTIEEEE